MDNGLNEGSQATDDLLASLTFLTAEDDARYRCLIDRFSAQANTEGFVERASLDFRGEVLKSWCDASGTDGSECIRGFVDLMDDRGSRGSVVWAYRDRPESPVQEYGYRVARNPAVDSAATWGLRFQRIRGATDRFSAIFRPFDGERSVASVTNFFGFAKDARYSIEGQGVDDVVAEIEPRGTGAELLAMLVESPERFEQLLADSQDALLAEYERLIAQTADIDGATRAAVIGQARSEIGAKRAILAENAVEMHALLREAVLGEVCG